MATTVSSPSKTMISGSPQELAENTLSLNAQFQITSLLQTTIEIEPLLELFFGQLQHLLKLSSCQFQNEKRKLLVKLGSACAHSCNYSLSIQQEYLGDLTLTRRQRFSDDELVQIEALLGTLVYPLRNAINYHDAVNQALRDPLTGLGNRGALDSALEHQYQMAQRYDQDLGILMVDIDHFKKINDSFGHDVGDYVIKQVAQSINATTRQTDLIFRYGGEEFLILLNKTSTTGSIIIAERIRENIEALSLEDHQGKPFSVTASVGGSLLRPGVDKNELMKEADNALYMAKNEGRNRVEFFKKATDESSCYNTHLSI